MQDIFLAVLTTKKNTPSTSHSKLKKPALASALAAILVTGGTQYADAATLTLLGPNNISEGTSSNIRIGLAPEGEDFRFGLGGDDPAPDSCTVSGNLAFAASDSSATEEIDFTVTDPDFTITYMFNDGVPIIDDGQVTVNAIADEIIEDNESVVLSAQNIVDNCSFYGGVNTSGSDITMQITERSEGEEGEGGGEVTPLPAPPSGNLADISGLSSRQVSVATVLDQSCATITAIPSAERTAAQNELLAVCTQLQSSATLTRDLNNLLSEEFFSMTTLAKQSSRLQSQNIARQIRRVRAGLGGNDISGLNITLDGQQLSGHQLGQLLGAGAGDENLNSPWGSFVGGAIQIGERDETNSSQAYEFDVSAFHTGFDYKLNKHVVLGAVIGYTDSSAGASDDIGQTDVSGISLGLFSSYYYNDNYYIDTIISYGQSDYETKRDASFASTSQTAYGDTKGDELNLSLNTGYYFRYSNKFLHLLGNINYIDINIDSFQESNNNGSTSGTLLNVDKQNQQSLTTNIGAELGWTINTNTAVVTPQLSLDWEHQYDDDAQQVSGSFVGDLSNNHFNIEDDEQDQNYFNAGLSISAVFKGGFSAYGAYEIDLSRDELDLYDISIGARWEF